MIGLGMARPSTGLCVGTVIERYSGEMEIESQEPGWVSIDKRTLVLEGPFSVELGIETTLARIWALIKRTTS
jgi:hypothetical protein